MRALAAVALGGALGAVARWSAAGWVQRAAGGTFPWGTMAVNVAGSFLLGFLLVWLRGTVASPEVRQFAAVGVLGSFTTFSTLSWETAALLQDGEWTRAGGYALGSFALGLGAVVAGAVAAEGLRG